MFFSSSNKIIFFLAIILNTNVFAQSTFFKIDWNQDTLYFDNQYLNVSNNLVFEGKTPKISLSEKVDFRKSITIKNVFYEPLNKEETSFIKNNGFKIDSNFVFKFSNSTDQNQIILNLFFSAFVFKNDKILKVVSIEYQEEKEIFEFKKKRNLNQFSVLSDVTSQWYRFRVNKSGFYKITYSQLKNLGYEPKQLGFKAFHIYGNSFGKLPELNAEYLDLDLVQNSVIYEGASDGVFDENDAIVFYSSGPNKIDLSKDGLLVRDLNIYTDYSSYFIRVSPNTKTKEVNILDKSYSNYLFEYNDFLGHFIYENEDTSLVYGGKRWYGELLDLNKRIDISIPNFGTKLNELNLHVSGATNARIFGSYLNVYLDNQLIGNLVLSSVSSEFIRLEKNFKIPINSGFSTISLELIRNSPDTKFFLDKVELNAFKNIASVTSGELILSPNLIGKGIFKLNLPNIQYTDLYDVTNPCDIKKINTTLNSNYIIDSMASLKKYVLYSFNEANQIYDFYPVKNQNLHGVDLVDMIIVTPSDFIKQANDLKSIHEKEGLRVIVVTDQEIYNEFSSGEMDPTGIKQFARFIYNKQRNNPKDRLKYLLLFGDGTFDYKNRIKGNNNILPTFQFDESEDFLSAMVSDDYFGMMDDYESLKGEDLMDIGVGRMLISNQQQAEQMIAKIKSYIDNIDVQSDWLTKIALIADDEEGGYFILNDAEPQTKYLKNFHPEINVVKLYSDAFQQISTAGGERYPLLNKMIDNQFFNGSLVVSYVGHGGPSGAGEERFMTIEQIANYQNKNKLPLFMSSTCEFTKYDDPTRVSAGEVMYLNPSGGAIALMTTSRPVFFGVNTISGNSFYKNVLLYDSISNNSLTFGEIFRRTKNQSGTSSNRRSFTLIGDPALRINFPTNKIVIDSINSIPVDKYNDTLKALSKVLFHGHVENRTGNNLNQNGSLMLSLYDKSKKKSTLGQNVDSPILEFETQNSILFKGLASLKNGKFKVEFVLPKDLDINIGKGKISSISIAEGEKGIGNFDSLIIGGISLNIRKDSIGPDITLSLDSSRIIENGFFKEDPMLYVKLSDESGINLSSSGIGHQIGLIINDKVSEIIDLNPYYVADRDTYKSGRLTYPLTNLPQGRHKLKLKAWDVYNNSSEKELNFTIANSQNILINRILNYPNPFTTNTSFYVEQNSNEADVKIEILSISGKLIKEYKKENVSFRSTFEKVFDWDGLDQFGDKIAKGVYIYRITISNQSSTSSKIEKLVIF